MKYLFSLLILFLTNFVNCQQNNSKPLYYNWFDTIIGITNTSLFQGMEYVEAYPMANDEHRFFNDFEFILGDVNFEGQKYFNMRIKYDVFGDQLLLKASVLTGTSTIILNKEKISTFTIGEHHFFNLKADNPAVDDGIYEILVKNELFTIYKKHKKKIRKKLDKTYAYYSFKDKNKYFVFYNKAYYALNSPKSLGSVFKAQKELIKKSYLKYSPSKNTTIDETLILAAKDVYHHLLAYEH